MFVEERLEKWNILAKKYQVELESDNISFDTDSKVFWHSSAHVLGQALEIKYGCHLSVGPPLKEGGFYYEGYMPDNKVILPEDFKDLEEIIKKIVKENQSFEKMIISKEDALNLFEYNNIFNKLHNRK